MVKALRIGFALLALPWMFSALHAANTAASEYEVKAAFLYNFAKFIEWPADAVPDTGFKVCVLGENPFGDALAGALEGKTVREKPLGLKFLTGDKEAGSCQVLYISTSEKSRLPAILEAVRESPVLTVSDTPRFIDQGGIIGFSIDQNHVRFSVNLKAADKARLTVSSQLLKLAKTVIGTPPAP